MHTISVFTWEYKMYVNTVVTFYIRTYFKNYFINSREHFFHDNIISSKQSGGWENSRKLLPFSSYHEQQTFFHVVRHLNHSSLSMR